MHIIDLCYFCLHFRHYLWRNFRIISHFISISISIFNSNILNYYYLNIFLHLHLSNLYYLYFKIFVDLYKLLSFPYFLSFFMPKTRLIYYFWKYYQIISYHLLFYLLLIFHLYMNYSFLLLLFRFNSWPNLKLFHYSTYLFLTLNQINPNSFN